MQPHLLPHFLELGEIGPAFNRSHRIKTLSVRRRHPEEEVQKTGRSCFVNELGRTPKYTPLCTEKWFMCFHTFRSLGVFSSPCGQHSNRATTARRADGRRRSASPQRMLCNLANAVSRFRLPAGLHIFIEDTQPHLLFTFAVASCIPALPFGGGRSFF